MRLEISMPRSLHRSRRWHLTFHRCVANMAKAMGIEESQLNIKATTEEKLGFTGREEGIASQAICLLYEKKDA